MTQPTELCQAGIEVEAGASIAALREPRPPKLRQGLYAKLHDTTGETSLGRWVGVGGRDTNEY